MLVAAGVIVACGGDSTVVTTPNDGGGDQADVITPIVDPDPPDVVVPQDAGTDSGITLTNYPQRIAESMCKALAKCCFGNANLGEDAAVDGGTFEKGECLDLYGRLGFENANFGQFAIASGNVELDRAKADDCFAKIDSLACELTGSALKTIRSSCFDALKGKLGVGQPCRADIECQTGHFCNPTLGVSPAQDAGAIVGVCAALRGADQSCDVYPHENDDNAANYSESACSNRGGGAPAMRCDSWDGVSVNYRPREEWLCKPTVANGQACNSTVWCADGICDPDDFTCKTPLQYFSRYSCEAHVGPGGS